jgi:protein-S-isoprenylcysteine O-methyltransferase Ste14
MFSLLVPMVIVIFSRPTIPLLLAGAALALVGEAIRIWAAGCIDKNAALACKGPFAYVRNPLYLGSLFIAAGYCVMSGLWWAYVVMALLYWVFYVGTIEAEEEHLRSVLGEPYLAYCQVVPRLVPRATPLRNTDGPAFSWARVRNNREQQSIYGVTFFLVAFTLVCMYHPNLLPGAR